FSPDHTAGAMIELLCETDFVARNDAFREAARELAEQVLAKGPDGLAEQTLVKGGSKAVRDFLTDLNTRTGENINLGRAVRVAGAGRVESYVHHDGKSGALVDVAGEGLSGEALSALARDLALQVVAARPVAARREDVPAEVVAEQKRIFVTQVANTMGD